MRVTVDAGHGGRDPGASSHGVVEKVVALDVAVRVAELLKAAGHVPLMSRTTDRYVDLPVRAHRANRYEADRFLSIHVNAALSSEAQGIETWFYNGSKQGRRLAATVQAGMLQEFTESADRGIKEGNFAVLRLTRMPAVLVELGFVTNAWERAQLAKPEWRERAAFAVARAIVEPADAA